MTMPGFTATASLYRARGHYYQAAGEALTLSSRTVSLGQIAPAQGIGTSTGSASCSWLDPNDPSGRCTYTVSAAYDSSGNIGCRIGEVVSSKPCLRWHYCRLPDEGPPPLGPRGESTWTGRITGNCKQTKRLYYDGNCQLIEDASPPVCTHPESCPEGWDDCIRNCRNEGGSGPECSRYCIGRGCD